MIKSRVVPLLLVLAVLGLVVAFAWTQSAPAEAIFAGVPMFSLP
jgi:uncharacterized membrane protein